MITTLYCGGLEEVVGEELSETISLAMVTRNNLYKDRNFHKSITKLSKDEFSYQVDQFNLLSGQLVEIFLLLPLPSFPQQTSTALRSIQLCLAKLKTRLQDYEALAAEKRPDNPFGPSPTSPPPQFDEEDYDHPPQHSPPFDPSPDLEPPSSPVFSRTSQPSVSRDIPAPAVSHTDISIQPKTKFVFKKPVSGNVPACKPDTPSTSSNINATVGSSTSSYNYSQNSNSAQTSYSNGDSTLLSSNSHSHSYASCNSLYSNSSSSVSDTSSKNPTVSVP